MEKLQPTRGYWRPQKLEFSEESWEGLRPRKGPAWTVCRGTDVVAVVWGAGDDRAADNAAVLSLGPRLLELLGDALEDEDGWRERAEVLLERVELREPGPPLPGRSKAKEKEGA